jgi:ABC-type glycerol-3-phosphate transport system substrate-binding protein
LKEFQRQGLKVNLFLKTGKGREGVKDEENLSVGIDLIGRFFLYAGGGQAQPQGSVTDSNTASFMWWGDENRHKATNKAVEEFLKVNPGKTITTLPNPFDGYHDKIIIQLANGTAPDLICYSTEWMSEVGFAPNPVLKDLNEFSSIIDFSTKGQKVLADLGVLTGNVYTSTQYLMQSAGAPYTPFILIPELMDALRNEYSRFIMGNTTAETAGKNLYNDWQRMLTSIRRTNGL